MRRKHLILFLLLLAAAGVIGWFLPVLITSRQDAALEGRPEPVPIRQIDLSYQTDLSAADKMRLMRERPSTEAVPLERGIFMTDRDVRSVIERFLLELTGNSFEPDAMNYGAKPTLLSFGSEGSVLVWNVTAHLNDAWFFEAVVDDQTGLLLQCTFYGSLQRWEALFRGLEGAEDLPTRICSLLADALCAHCSRQLPASYTVSLTDADMDASGACGQFLLSQNGQDRMRVPFMLVLTEGFLAINQ